MTSILATSVALRDTLYTASQNSEFPWQNAISLLTVFISALMAYIAWTTLREHNRPYITFNIEADVVKDLIFFYFRNTGIRGAHDVEIHIKPKPESSAFTGNSLYKNVDEYKFGFLAPNQEIRSFFDQGAARYPKGEKPDKEEFDITVRYRYRRRKFKENYKCDLSYLNCIWDVSDPFKLGTDITKGEDNSRNPKLVKRIIDNHAKTIL